MFRFFKVSTREREAKVAQQKALATIAEACSIREQAEENLRQVQEAWARHWAVTQMNKAYVQHLEQHIETLEAALRSR